MPSRNSALLPPCAAAVTAATMTAAAQMEWEGTFPASWFGDGNWLAVGAPCYPVQNEGLRGRVFLYAYNNDLFSDCFEQ